jgi:hypothetical protein
MAHGDVEFELEADSSFEVSVMVEERNFAELAGEFACDNF